MTMQLFDKALTQYSATDTEGVGKLRVDEAGNMYKWVKNNLASSITATQYGLACYDGSSRTTVTSFGTLANVAGAWQAAVPGQQYGWIQIKGAGSLVIMRSAAATNATYASIAALAALKPVSAAEYAVTTNAVQHPDRFFFPAASAATVQSNGSTSITSQITALFDFLL